MKRETKNRFAIISYIILSYPLNWLFLQYIILPMGKGGWLGPMMAYEDVKFFGEITFVLSPIILPIELFITLLCVVATALDILSPEF